MKRKQWGGCLLTALLLTAGAAGAEERFGVTGTDGAALRQAPSTSAALAGQYALGTWMTITGENGGWYAVAAPDGTTGYMSARQVEVPAITVANVGVVCNLADNAYVNLRQQPHYQAAVLATYHNGAPCLLLSHSNGWYHVRIEGVEGYLREEYVRARMTVWAEDVATVITRGHLTAALRSGPGTQYAPLASLGDGQYVTVLQRGSGWWYVACDGLTGYVDAASLREGVLTYGEIADAGWAELASAWAVVNNPSPTQLLNLREMPSTLGAVLGQYRSGARLTLLNQGLEWCRVMDDAGVTGYMMTDYLLLEGVPEVPVMTVTHPDGTYVNLRTAPSMYLGAVLFQVPHGTQVTVLIPGSEWVKVRWGDETGYMAAGFLTP